MLLRKEIYFHFFTNLIKNLLGPQSQISIAQWPGLLVEITMVDTLFSLMIDRQRGSEH